MIRTTNLHGTAKRRIAVIELPRPHRARMGSTGPAPDAPTAWTTLSDDEPDSSANWIGYILMRQARHRETTPGTLTYTPASDHPAANVAPWNSWLQPNCPPSMSADPAPAAGETKPDFMKLFLLFGAVTATAAAVYLLDSTTHKGGR